MTRADSACSEILEAVRLARQQLPRGRHRVLVAFSGGPDSTALLWSLLQDPSLDISAVHLDHRLDGDSGRRAREALTLARKLGATCRLMQLSVPRDAGQSLEEAARKTRYEALAGLAQELGASFLATGHHADDQAETVVLRALSGTRLRGLQAMRTLDGTLWRPLLGLRRATLQRALAELGIRALQDPTNLETGPLRNRVRHAVLPRLREERSDLTSRLCAVAEHSRRAFERLDDWLDERLQIERRDDLARLDLERWLQLPEPLQEAALERLHRTFGHRRPASRAAMTELRRQLASSGDQDRRETACDCGSGLRWRLRERWLQLERAPRRGRTEPLDFTYTVQIPGRFRIPEISASILIEPSDREPHTAHPPGCHALFSLPPKAHTLTIRNRRPGDRAHDRHGSRTLKRLLAELDFPAPLRARLPLLCDRHRILWIPGFGVHPEYAARSGAPQWRATFVPGAGRAGISDWAEALHRLARSAASRHQPS